MASGESRGQHSVISGRIGETCSLQTDCLHAVKHSHCTNSHTCACDFGYIADNNGSICRRRVVGDRCDVIEECLFSINDVQCHHTTCLCNLGRKPINNNTACKIRIIGDTCDVDEDCWMAIKKTRCDYYKRCTCNNGYERAPNRTLCLSTFDTEQISILAFSTIAIVTLAFVNVVLVVWLCYEFVPRFKKMPIVKTITSL